MANNDLVPITDETGGAGLGASADTSSITAPPPPAPQTWGGLAIDTGKLAVGSTEGAIGAGERFIAPYMSDPNAWRQSGASWVDAGQKMSSSLSPAGQQTTDAPFFSMETLQHPINKTVMGIGKQGPWLAPALIPGGGVAAMAGRAAIGGVLGYTGAYSGVIDAINAQPDDQLQQKSPTYMELRKTLPEWDAKNALGDQAWSNVPAWEKAAIVGTSALAGEAGPMTTVGKTVAGSAGRTLAAKYAEGRLAKAGINAVETGAVTGAQYAGTAIPTREALTSVGAPADTSSDITRSTIETTAMGAVVGGGTRFIRPHGGKNESRSDTRGDWPKYVEPKITEVPAGQADPGQAASLKSAIGEKQGPPEMQGPPQPPQPPPSRTAPIQHPDNPFPTAPTVWPGMGEDANRPPPPTPPPGPEPPPTPPPAPPPPAPPSGRAPIPARPVPQPVRQPAQGELPLAYERPNVPRQGEMPLQAPQPQRPAPEQGTLDLQRAPQPVVQRGLPGIGTDVVHEPAAPLVRSPDQDSPAAQYAQRYDQQGRMRNMLKQKEAPAAEPEAAPAPAAAPEKPTAPKGAALKKGKAAAEKKQASVTNVSEPEPTAAPVKAAAAAKAVKPTKATEPVITRVGSSNGRGMGYQLHADGVPIGRVQQRGGGWKAGNIIHISRENAEKYLIDRAAKSEVKPAAKAEAPIKETTLKKGTISLAELQAKIPHAEASTEKPAPTARQQAAIDKLVGKKTIPTQVERPTVEAKGEVPVTVVPPTSAHLGGIKHGPEALKAAAEAVAAVRKAAKEKIGAVTEGTIIKDLKDLKPLKKAIETAEETAARDKVDRDRENEVLRQEQEDRKARGGTSDILSRIEKAFEGESDEHPIEKAKGDVAKNPTDAQSAAGNFKQGHLTVDGQPVTIHSAEGKVGEAEGHILGTADNVPGEHLNTIIHPDGVEGSIHVINALDKDTGMFSHHVAVLGARNSERALNIYRGLLKRNGVDEEKANNLSMGIEHMSKEDFERWKQTRNPEEPVYPTATGTHPFDKVEVFNTITKKIQRVDTLGSSTLKTALQEALHNIPNDVRDPNYRLYTIYRKLAEQVIRYLPDVPVYYLHREVFDSLIENANAFYNGARNHILIASGETKDSPEITLLHEALHAASWHLYYTNRAFKIAVDKIYAAYKAGVGSLGPKGETMSTNVIAGKGVELLADLANPKVARQLAQIRMSSRLANDLKMDKWAAVSQTLWNGLVNAFKTALERIGFEIPGRDDPSKFTLLDGMLRTTDQAFVNRSKLARTDFAKMVRAMGDYTEGGAKSIREEHNSQQNIYDTIHDVVSNPENLQIHYENGAKSISDKASDLVDRLPKGVLKQKAYEWIVPFKGSDALRMDTEHLWGAKTEANPARRWGETNLKRDGYLTSLITKVNNTIHDMYSEYRGRIKAETEHLADTMAQATAYRVDPRHPIGEGNNAWLAKPGWRWRNEAQQALANYDRIVKMYNDIHPELKPRFTKLADEYHAAGLERAKLAANELIDSITNAGQKFLEPLNVTNPKEIKVRDRQEYIKFHNDWETNWDKNKEKLREQLLTGNLGENEERWLKERGFDDVSDIDKLANPRGLFVPLDHAGQFGINGEYKIEKPTNGIQVAGKDNVFDFKTEAEAEAFYNKQPPNSHMVPVYFNDEGKEASRWDKWQKPDGSIGFAKDNKAYRVEVNNKYYSGHDSISAGNKRYAQLKASGAFSKLSLPQSKRSGWYQGLSVSSPLFNHLMASVDKRTDYTNAQKEAVKSLLRDTALSSLEGNRIAKHMIERKAVAGWDTDYIKTYKSYMDAHNTLISRVKYSKDMNSAINDMIDYADEHQGEEGATERGYVLDELNKRDNFFGTPNDQGEEKGGFAGRVLKYAEAASFFAHMVSPGHLITHQTHQILTYDILAAKYGPLKAAAMAGKMHSIMAGTGFRNVIRSIPEMIKIITKDSKGLNYVEGLMDKMGQHPKYGADLIRMLNEAIATNRIHPDQGFDASVLHMGSGRLDRGLARLDLASRQMMGSTEAYSRVWGYSLGYALARDAGETHEQAMRTAFDTVSRTQGLLSRSNMSSRMNKWYMRAPMQFRAWGINMMVTHANTIYNIFKPDAPGVRAEAVRRLLYMFGSTAALTGINGLPSDPMRVGLALAGALGLTNYNWSDAQDKMREFFAKETSPGMANFLMDGAVASLGPFSFFGGDRIGFGSLAVFGEPDSYSKGDISKWLLEIMGGAPFGEISPMTIGEGIKALQEGNYAKATQVFVPLKLVSDWAKAWQGMYEGFPTKTGAPGMEPYSAGETFMQSIGLTPARRERFREASTAEYRANKSIRDEHSQLLDALGTAATEPDRIKARMQIAAFNLRNPQNRITPQDVMRAARRQTAPSGLGRTLYRGNKERIQSLERYYEAY